jgi:hypothetical protein
MTDRTAESPVAAAAALAEATGVAAHDVAVMLGSGWRPAADLLGTPSHEIAMADLLGSCAATHNVHLVMSNYPDISRTRRRWRTGCG